MLSHESESSGRQQPLLQHKKIQDAMPQTEMTQEEAAIKSKLQQIYNSYQQGHWTQVIAGCEAVMAHCRQRTTDEATVRNASSGDMDAEKTALNTVSPDDQQAAIVAELHIAKGNLFLNEGNIDSAIQAYEQALTLQSQQKDLLQKVEELYGQQSQKEKANGNIAGATQICLQAIQKHLFLFSIYNRLRYNLMRYETAAGDPILEEVVQVFREIVAQKPMLLAAQVTLGYALTKAGQKEAAISTYRHATEISTRRQIKEKLANPEAADSIHFSQQRRDLDYLIIGAEKSGTTSLYQYLRQHPEVLSSVEKEIDFFDMEYEHGIDWYLAHFPPAFEQTISKQSPSQPQKWITGETSANYLYSNVTPARVFKHFPNIKLAVILRNPIDRAVSRYNMMMRNGVEQRTLETAVQEEMTIIQNAMMRSSDGQTIPWKVLNRCRHVGNSLYYYHLERWLSVFPAKQLFVIQSEELFTQPAQTLAQLYTAFGLSAHTVKDYPKHNSGRYSPAESSVRQQLSDFFAPHTRKLETLLGRSFDWNL